MKELILALALTAISVHSYGQGTVVFGNTIATRVSHYNYGELPIDLPTSLRVNFGIFWGHSLSEFVLNDGPLGVSSDTFAGIIVAPGTYNIKRCIAAERSGASNYTDG